MFQRLGGGGEKGRYQQSQHAQPAHILVVDPLRWTVPLTSVWKDWVIPVLQRRTDLYMTDIYSADRQRSISAASQLQGSWVYDGRFHIFRTQGVTVVTYYSSLLFFLAPNMFSLIHRSVTHYQHLRCSSILLFCRIWSCTLVLAAELLFSESVL